MLRLVSFAKKETPLLGGQKQRNQLSGRPSFEAPDAVETWREEMRRSLWSDPRMSPLNDLRVGGAVSSDRLFLESPGVPGGKQRVQAPPAAETSLIRQSSMATSGMAKVDDTDSVDSQGFGMMEVLWPGLRDGGDPAGKLSRRSTEGRKSIEIKSSERRRPAGGEEAVVELTQKPPTELKSSERRRLAERRRSIERRRSVDGAERTVVDPLEDSLKAEEFQDGLDRRLAKEDSRGMKRLGELQGELDRLSSKLAEKDSELATALQRLAAAEAVETALREEKDEAVSKAASLEAEVAAERASKENLQKALTSVEKEAAVVGEKLKAAESSMEILRAEKEKEVQLIGDDAAVAATALDEILTEKLSLEAELNKMEGETKVLKEGNEALAAKSQEFAEQLKAAQVEVEELKLVLGRKEEEMKAFEFRSEADAGNFKLELQINKEQCQQLGDQLKAAQEALQDMKVKVESSARDLQASEAELGGYKKKNEELLDQLNDALVKLSAAKEETEEMKKQAEAAQSELQHTKEKTEQAAREAKDVEEQLQGLKQRAEVAEGELKAALVAMQDAKLLAEGTQGQLTSSETQMRCLTERAEETAQELKAAQAAMEKNTELRVMAEAQAKDLQGKLEVFRAESEQKLRAIEEELGREVLGLRAASDALEVKLRAAEEEVQAHKQKSKLGEEKAKVALEEANVFKQRWEAGKEQLKVAQEAAPALKEKSLMAEEKLKAVVGEKEKLRGAMEKDVGALKQELVEVKKILGAEVQRLTRMVQELESEKEDRGRAAELLRQQFTEAEEGRSEKEAALSTEVENLKRELEVASRREASALVEVERLKLESAGLKVEVDRLLTNTASKMNDQEHSNGVAGELGQVKVGEEALLAKPQELLGLEVGSVPTPVPTESNLLVALTKKEEELTTLKARLAEVEEILVGLGYEREVAKPNGTDTNSELAPIAGIEAGSSGHAPAVRAQSGGAEAQSGGVEAPPKATGASNAEKAGRWVMKHCVSVEALRKQHELEKKLSRREVLNYQREVEELKAELEKKDKLCAELKERALGKPDRDDSSGGNLGLGTGPETTIVARREHVSERGDPAELPDGTRAFSVSGSWKHTALRPDRSLTSPMGVSRGAGQRVKAAANVLMQRLAPSKGQVSEELQQAEEDERNALVGDPRQSEQQVGATRSSAPVHRVGSNGCAISQAIQIGALPRSSSANSLKANLQSTNDNTRKES